MLCCVFESITGMEDGQIIHILNVALLKVEFHVEPLAEKMESVKSLCLSLCDRRDSFGSWQGSKACEISASILENYALWQVSGDRLIVKEGLRNVGFRRIAKVVEEPVLR